MAQKKIIDEISLHFLGIYGRRIAMKTIRALISNYVINVSLFAWLAEQAFQPVQRWFQINQRCRVRSTGTNSPPSALVAAVCTLSIAI